MKYKFIFPLLLGICIMLYGCSSDNSVDDSISADSTERTQKDISEYSELEILFHRPFIDITGIELSNDSERGQAITHAQELLQTGNGMNVTEEDEWWGFAGSHYAITNNNSLLTYYGETKDNRPDGFGVIAMVSDEQNYKYLYIGNFKNGKFDGYGAKFNEDIEDYSSLADELVAGGTIDPKASNFAADYFSNYVSYDGEWSKGKPKGQGNSYEMFSLYEEGWLYTKPIDGYWASSIYPNLVVGEFDNDFQTGTFRVYDRTTLIYDGELKNGSAHGEGTQYNEDGFISYEGHWKNGEYDGEGTLYNSEGEEIYSGKWDNGDFAD